MELWQAATALAQVHGLSPTEAALKKDRYDHPIQLLASFVDLARFRVPVPKNVSKCASG